MKGIYEGEKCLVVETDHENNGYGIIMCDDPSRKTIWVRKSDVQEYIPETKEDETDNINPNHYKRGGIETFDYLKAKMTPVQLEGYLLGNCLKYLSRYQYKNGVEDLKKCEWYVKELVSLKG